MGSRRHGGSAGSRGLPARRTREATRELLEYLITRGTVADLANADPAWLKAPPPDDGAFEWYSQFGDASKVMRGRAELLQMVVDLQRSSKAPAAGVLNAAAWFDEWVELPQPALGSRSPSKVLCTLEGLEAAKVILRSLQEIAGADHEVGRGPAKGIRSAFRVFALALVSIAATGLAAKPAACAAEEVNAAATEPLRVVVLPARAHVMRAGFVQSEEVKEWADAARENLDSAINDRVSQLAAFGLTPLPTLSAEEQLEIEEFVSVANVAITRFDGFTLFGGVGVQRTAADRTLGPSLAFLHDRTGADYAIGAFAFQLEQSKRVAAVGSTIGLGLFAGGGIVTAPPVSFSYVTLFVADLRTGELRWGNVENGYEVAGLNFSDLRDAQSVDKTISKLLARYPEVRWATGKKQPKKVAAARASSPPQGGFAVQMPTEWRLSQLDNAISATRDGRGLNEITVELRDHDKAFPASGGQVTSNSSPAQLAEAFVADLTKQELPELDIIQVSTDAQLVGKPAFRVHFSHRLSGPVGGAKLERVATGTALPRGLLIAQIDAPQLGYFERVLPAFEEVIPSIVLKPRRHLH